MTRETKIGLLVGLAFIIVIGVLLSDHFTSTMQPPRAALVGTMETVRQGINAPGNARRTEAVRIQDIEPDRTVMLPDRRREAGRVIVDVRAPGGNEIGISEREAHRGQGTQPDRRMIEPELAEELEIDVEEMRPMEEVHAEDVIRMEPQRPRDVNSRPYQAEAGDTLSKMAGRLLGANTKANRDAIVRLNPSLQQDPDRVVIGQTYLIPEALAGTGDLNEAERRGSAAAAPATSGEVVYTTKPGDNLWRIAVERVGSGAAVALIKEMNKDVLRNGDLIQPNMKLRLPAKVE